MTDERRAGRDPDWTDAEAEGQPDLDDQPPGIDDQTASEGPTLPRDHPMGVEELGVTAAGEAVPETVEERARRERPDTPQRPPEDPAGRLEAVDSPEEAAEGEAFAEWEADAAGLSAEEQAVHVRPSS
ncbi:MAG TPA: hypothetical protein VHB02_03015 [Acidimicrobiales bacterium]|nr:hypothetical protein [Acidimicrobiales bacterium]